VMLLKYGLGFSAMLIVLRVAWMFPGAWVAHWIRTRWLGQKRLAPSVKGTFVLGWTGMRGVVTLAAAIGLPYELADGRPFVQRDLIVFLAFSVILVTLVGQGLTLPMLVRALGMSGVDTQVVEERKIARATALEAAVAWLNAQRDKAEMASWPVIDNMLKVYQGRLQALCEPGPAESRVQVMKVQELVRGAAHEQRSALLKLRAEGRIGDEAMRVVERELDLMETRLDTASF
jgi:NhaP-type Na+/H+ or K+/H+ antiporter